MGWWKMVSPDSGGIDWKWEDSRELVNAVPGADDGQLLYNGDGPADAMGSLVEHLVLQFVLIFRQYPTYRVIRRFLESWFFDVHQARPDMDRQEAKKWARFIKKVAPQTEATLHAVTRMYHEAWGREPVPDEWKGVVNFVFNPDILPVAYGDMGRQSLRLWREWYDQEKRLPEAEREGIGRSYEEYLENVQDRYEYLNETIRTICCRESPAQEKLVEILKAIEGNEIAILHGERELNL